MTFSICCSSRSIIKIMSSFTFFLLCVQACLIQTVFSQQNVYSQNINSANSLNLVNQGIGVGSFGLPGSAINLGNSVLSAVSAGSCGTYGGQGTGQVGVAGDVNACGNTVVVGSVPVLGAVDFSGVVPASGSVSISGQCGCGCGSR